MNAQNGNGMEVDLQNGNCAPNVDLNVSASEQAKGGIKYEVVLDEAKVDATPPRVASPSAKKARPALSAELLKSKIEAAEQRRQSLEAEKIAKAIETKKKLEEAAKKRQEEEKTFVTTTKENLEQKMEAYTENRESIISGLKTKLSTHNTNHLQEVKQNLETTQTELEEKAKQEISAKLETAEKNREKILEGKLENLKKHDEKVELIRTKRNSIIGENGTTTNGNGESPPKPQ